MGTVWLPGCCLWVWCGAPWRWNCHCIENEKRLRERVSGFPQSFSCRFLLSYFRSEIDIDDVCTFYNFPSEIFFLHRCIFCIFNCNIAFLVLLLVCFCFCSLISASFCLFELLSNWIVFFHQTKQFSRANSWHCLSGT